MLDLFRKHKDDKRAKDEKESNEASKPKPGTASGSSAGKGHIVLEESDQTFIERILAQADEEAPPLPPRIKTPDISWESSSDYGVPAAEDSDEGEGKGKGKGEDKGKKGKDKEDKEDKHKKKGDHHHLHLPFSFLKIHTTTKKKSPSSQNLEPVSPGTSKQEAAAEAEDLGSVLDQLNLAAGKGNKAISLSAETSEVVGKFTLVIKDVMNGVPTAYEDLISLIEDHDGVLSRNYEKLPSSLKKLVMTLPTKLTSTLAPELLAVAAEAQGKDVPAGLAGAGADELKGAAKKLLSPASVRDLVTKPGAIASLLRAIVAALKTRWPAFMGTNVLWAVAVSILMFVVWYCHKRGREVRLEKDQTEKSGESVEGRIEELPDDPTLPAPTVAPAVVAEAAEPIVKATDPKR